MKAHVTYLFKGRTGWFEEITEHPTLVQAKAATANKAIDITCNGYWDKRSDGRLRWNPPTPVAEAIMDIVDATEEKTDGGTEPAAQ